MRPFVALDWGTTSLRAARVDGSGAVLELRESQQGILSVPAGGFEAVFEQACGDWMRDAGAFALIAGMAGSRQGWREAPYCPCPAGVDDIASRVGWVRPGRVAIVPGLSVEHQGIPDVMRGEETQVFGALHSAGLADATLVLPGTHSKWVAVRGGRIESFATFMTGEFYALLRRHSILSRTMAEGDGWDEAAFRRGLAQARSAGNLLRSAFSARTLGLFEQLGPGEAPSYLSGLVIGEELRSAAAATPGPVIVVGSDALGERYAIALREAGIEAILPGAAVTWLGLAAIASRMKDPS